MPADQGSEKVVAAAPDIEQTLETTSGKILKHGIIHTFLVFFSLF